MEILVKLEHFVKYQKKYNTTYLDKKNNYKIWAKSKTKILNKFVDSTNEMLDGTKTNYEAVKNANDYVLLFSTKNNDYRFDLQHEKDTSIYHLMFSEIDFKNGEDEKLTDKKEAIEVFSRLSFILKDFSKELKSAEFCIGASANEAKNRLYEYFMIYTKSWEKRNTQHYELGWALYFTI